MNVYQVGSNYNFFLPFSCMCGNPRGIPRNERIFSFVFRLYFRALFGTFLLKALPEQDCNGKKIPVPRLDVIMIAFF